MARIRQIHPYSYYVSSHVSDDITNIVRYLSSAELGNKTLSELMAELFDKDTGELLPGIELRVHDGYIEWRPNEDTDWSKLVALEELKPPPGDFIGDVTEVLLSARQEYVLVAGQVDLPYAVNTTDKYLVYMNGLLLRDSEFTVDTGNQQITLLVQVQDNDTAVLFTYGATSQADLNRIEWVGISGTTFNLGFVYTDMQQVHVYRNGLLLSYEADYTIDLKTDKITFAQVIQSTDVIIFINIVQQSGTKTRGVMMEEVYTDSRSRLIRYDRIDVKDGQIPQAKIADLVAGLSAYAQVIVSDTAPTAVQGQTFWVQPLPSGGLAVHFFYEGAWQPLTSQYQIPDFTIGDAGRTMAVNATATGLEWQDSITEGYLHRSQIDKPSGVAGLDASGRLSPGAMPERLDGASLEFTFGGLFSTGAFVNRLLFGLDLDIVQVAGMIEEGAASVQLYAGGVPIGPILSFSSPSPVIQFASIRMSSLVTPLKLTLSAVNADSSAKNLFVTFGGFSLGVP